MSDLAENFTGLNDHKSILLFLHDPEALANNALYEMLCRFRSRIAHIFCGHWHAQWNFWPNWLLAKIFNNWWLYPADLFIRIVLLLLSRNFRIPRLVKRDYQRFKYVPERMRELRVTIIPAPLGMLGFGGGFLTLDLETMQIKKY